MEQLRLPLTDDYYVPEPKYKVGEILKGQGDHDRIIVLGLVYLPRIKQFSYLVNNCNKMYNGYIEITEYSINRYKRE